MLYVMNNDILFHVGKAIQINIWDKPLIFFLVLFLKKKIIKWAAGVCVSECVCVCVCVCVCLNVCVSVYNFGPPYQFTY